jgi:hydrogenase maturation protease
MDTLVLGIGNTLLTDEGVGVHAVQYLKEHYTDLPDTEYLDGGTLSFTLAIPVEQADRLIVIDATQLNDEPGTVRTFIGAEMDTFLNKQTKRSVHEVGLIDLVNIARLTEQLPHKRALIGIQPEIIDWGEHPSPAVQAAIPVAVRKTVALIEEWNA